MSDMRSKVSNQMLASMTTIINLVEADWVDERQIHGNIYRALALGGVCSWISGGKFNRTKHNRIQQIMRLLGGLLVWLLQILGPVVLALNTFKGYGKAETQLDFTKFHGFNFSDWYKFDVLIKMIATMLLFCFICNAYFALCDDFRAWRNMTKIFRWYEKEGMNECWLWIDALTNCWCVVVCCIASYLVLGAAGGAKDVLFDALALLFLYNLDDIGGDLGFIAPDQWPGREFYWFYSRCKDEDGKDAPNYCCFLEVLFTFTQFVLIMFAILMPVAFVLTPFKALK